MPAIVLDQLLSVEQAAERMNVKVRFVRRLVEERRIAYVKVGRFVRIPSGVVDDFLRAGLVEPVRQLRGVA